MTAPGQEPEEDTSAEQDREPASEAGTPDLGAIGDNHMPEDLRRSVREEFAPADEASSSEQDPESADDAGTEEEGEEDEGDNGDDRSTRED